VFVDHLSFERRDPHDPVWRPYAQFVRSFLLPLLAHKHTALLPRLFFQEGSGGLELEEAARLLPRSARLRSPGRSLVTVPLLLSRVAQRMGHRLYAPRSVDEGQARFILTRLFGRLEKQLRELAPPVAQSWWSAYPERSHSADYQAAKQRMVADIVARRHPGRVLDVGCNVGEYAHIAARGGAAVVAIDRDSAALDRCWRGARANGLDILPLCVDIASPPGGAGWLNQEHLGFLDRAHGQFDMVLALAVVHHLVVDAGAPLTAVMRLLSELTRDVAVVEFVARSDDCCRSIIRGRPDAGVELTHQAFEVAARCWFTIESVEKIGESARVLYVLRTRGG
jgi:SAM-dependent methyltransferase